VAFMDVQPITHGHMLVVSREHAVLMADLNDATAMRSFRVARKLASIARSTLGAAGVNRVGAEGEIFRRTIGYSLILTAAVGIVAMIEVYLIPGIIPTFG